MSCVLIVDDNPADRALLRTALGRSGFTVHEAAYGREALAKAREVLPHVIVLDVNLPDTDGHSVCRALRADDPVSDVESTAPSTALEIAVIERSRSNRSSMHCALRMASPLPAGSTKMLYYFAQQNESLKILTGVTPRIILAAATSFAIMLVIMPSLTVTL